MGEREQQARGSDAEPLVFVTCPGVDRYPCHEGAIYVPEVGPMGDSFHETVEEARAAGDHWRWRYVDGRWLCRRCQDILDAQARSALGGVDRAS